MTTSNASPDSTPISTATLTAHSLTGRAEGEAPMALIAKTFQGLEPCLAQELTELGATDIQIGRRMVSFRGDKAMLYRANFCLRTAIRVLRPIKHFRARSADDVYDAVQEVDWTQWLSEGDTFAVDSVVYSNEFRHSKFVAYKVKDAIVDQLRDRRGQRPNVSVTNPDIQLHIHISDYDATLALDSSGESLHRRGYRQENVAAPINEVLAAGILLMTGWHGERDLLDPFCGSATFCIEAALIARGIAPGVYRQSYAFQRWPDYDPELFEAIYNDDSAERPFEHHIYGRDIDATAVSIARRNVKAAGLSRDITIEQADLRDTSIPLRNPEAEAAIIVTNPPYGERVSSPNLLELYHTLGSRLKREWAGGEAWVLSLHEECFYQIGLRPSLRTQLYNGALECELRKYQLFQGGLSDHRAAGGELKTDAERREMARPHRFRRRREEHEGEHEGHGQHADSNADNHRFNRYSNKEAYRAHRRERREEQHPDGRPFARPGRPGSDRRPSSQGFHGNKPRRPWDKPRGRGPRQDH